MAQVLVGGTRIEIVRGDITAQAVDAIVNAANTSLLGGGGVDGAIHRRGGPEILEECRKIVAARGGCRTGDAVVTTAGRLPARMVVHAVGPVWQGGDADEDGLLARTWTRCLELAVERGARTVAFPAISTGKFGYPVARAAAVSLRAAGAFAAAHPDALDLVRVVVFTDGDLAAWTEALGRICPGTAPYDRVVLRPGHPEAERVAGAVGYVIETFPDGRLEVEFSDPRTGVTVASLVLSRRDVSNEDHS